MTTQDCPPFRWNKARIQAAQLVAEEELTREEIAQKVGVTRRTVYQWQQHPEFAARVQELLGELEDIAVRYAVGRRARRVRWLNDRVERLHAVIRERAADPTVQEVPGGATGLLVRDVKAIGGAAVELFAVDTGLLRELREHERQAAQELGQWTEKNDLTSGGVPFKVYAGFDPQEALCPSLSPPPATSPLPTVPTPPAEPPLP